MYVGSWLTVAAAVLFVSGHEFTRAVHSSFFLSSGVLTPNLAGCPRYRRASPGDMWDYNHH